MLELLAPILGAGISLIGANKQANAAKDAAQIQADAALKGQQMQLDAQRPWIDAGTEALGQLRKDVLSPDGKYAQPFTMADAKNSEAMQTALRTGSEAIQNSAASRGGLLGTNTLQDLTKFGQETGAQYENQAFNQWLAERQAMLNPIQSLAGQGQSSSQQVADNNTNLTLAGANATAAGKIGGANAQADGINNAVQQFTMLSKLFGSEAGSNPPSNVTIDTGFSKPDYSFTGMNTNLNGPG